MKKIFSNITMLAALLVAGAAFTACSNESDSITTIEQPTVNGQKVYTMTIQAGKSSNATTRALELSGSTLTAKWANGDEVTVFNGTTPLGTLTASSTSADGKSCTLSGTLAGDIEVGNSLTLAYHPIGTSLSAIQTAISAQTGKLESAAALDYATANVTVKAISGGAITINEPSAAFSGQTSVLKITMRDASSNAINAKSLTVALTYLTNPLGAFTFSSLDPTDGVIYLTLPTQAQVAQALALASGGTTNVATATTMLSGATITFTANDGSYTYTASKTGYTFAAAKYYGTTLTAYRMAANAVAEDVGKLICTDGHIHTYNADAACTKSRVAKIIYVGSSTDDATYNHGLALALTDEGSSGMAWEAAKTACTNKTAVTGASWMLPSKTQWETMGATESSTTYETLRDGFTSVGGSNLQSTMYWSGTEDESEPGCAWVVEFEGGRWGAGPESLNIPLVRACLAF